MTALVWVLGTVLVPHEGRVYVRTPRRILHTLRSLARRVVAIDEATFDIGPRLDQLRAELDAVQSSLTSIRKDLGTFRTEHTAVLAELVRCARP